MSSQQIEKVSRLRRNGDFKKESILVMLGSLLMKIQINSKRVLWRYHYRNKNTVISTLKFLLNRYFNEKPGEFIYNPPLKQLLSREGDIPEFREEQYITRFSTYSPQMDHIIDLILTDNKLTEIRIDGEKITEKYWNEDGSVQD